jgi:DNA-binding transcriptional regulator YdaS (Cro superfamily)
MTIPKPTPHRALVAAVFLCKSQAEFGRLINKSRARVNQLLNDTDGVCPAESVLKVEAATGVPRHALRPDIYPMEAEPNG